MSFNVLNLVRVLFNRRKQWRLQSDQVRGQTQGSHNKSDCNVIGGGGDETKLNSKVTAIRPEEEGQT